MYFPRSTCLVLALFFVIAESDSEPAPLIKTKFGWITGTWSVSFQDNPIANYLGIPYAEPPVDNLRFRSPRPWTRSWTGIRNATRNGPPCVQRTISGLVSGEEDCLYLNVFVPKITKPQNVTSKHPVLVFIHGGLFNLEYGNGKNYQPTYLVNEPVILVVMNYRVGPLGFFSLANKAAPGNYGLKDILLALKWVQENIEDFGGDPNLVTLMGHGAGAGATHILALSNKTEGLFNKYILHSGSALATWAVLPKKSIVKSSLDIARRVGCPVLIKSKVNENTAESYRTTAEFEKFDGEKMIECMRSVNATHIFKNLPELEFLWENNPYCIFGPTLEDDSIEDAILSIPPMEIIEKHLFRDMPCIIGVVRDEGLIKILEPFLGVSSQRLFTDNFVTVLLSLFEIQGGIRNASELTKSIKDFYFGGNINYNLTKVIQMVGDGIITWPTFKAVKYLSKVTNSSLYFFLFNYQGTYSSTFYSTSYRYYGIAHGDDLNYLFPFLNDAFPFLLLRNNRKDLQMIELMTEMWTNFMKWGEPIASNKSHWSDYRFNHEYMRLGDGIETDIEAKTDFLPDRMKFWETLMGNLSEEAFKLEQMMSRNQMISGMISRMPSDNGPTKSTVSRAYDSRVPSLMFCFATIVTSLLRKVDRSNIIGL